MHYRADLHVHSKYSIATSRHADLETYYSWAQIKGIDVIGTGDFTHPGWFAEIVEKLKPVGNGFFRLKNKPATDALKTFKSHGREVQFCLSSEISSIFKKNGRVYKVHSLIYVPDLNTARAVSEKLKTIGNIRSDGRPILKLNPRDLLEIVKEASVSGYLIPAHIWTPWFSILGSKSGFNSIEECFEDLTEEIFALETGLSSDPAMNRLWSNLDRYTLISNSDAHSPNKLGREVNLFNTGLNYESMFTALKNGLKTGLKTGEGFKGTYEYFPEKGKYHLDGHRKCNVCLTPEETAKLKGICPVCGKSLTIGVLHRVKDCADRTESAEPAGAPGYRYTVPLDEFLSAAVGAGPSTKTVQKLSASAVRLYGDEYSILYDVSVKDVSANLGYDIGEKLDKFRRGEISLSPGYDGKFGTFSIGTA